MAYFNKLYTKIDLTNTSSKALIAYIKSTCLILDL